MTDRSSTLIDNILTNSVNDVYHSGTLYTDISDHFPIFLITLLDDKTTNVSKKMITYRKFNDKNINNFKKVLKDKSWDNVYTHTKANSAYQAFIVHLMQLLMNVSH